MLYLLSLFAVAGVIAVVFVTGRQHAAEAVSDSVGMETEVTEEPAEADRPQVTEEPQMEQTAETVPGDVEMETETGTEVWDEQDTGQVTLIFTGDVLFANAFQTGYNAKGIAGVIDDVLLEELKGADILMINNEFPFSDRGVPMEEKQFTFRCSPSYVKALSEMGVDIVSLANNHILDYGKEALRDTFDTLDSAGILYGGAGDTVERAEKLQVIEAGGRRYGFLAVSRVVPTVDWKVEYSAPGVFSCYDDTRLLALITEAKEDCDFLTVYPHWGVEYQEYPEDYQVRFAERWIEAGADLIVGSHTHCLQGVSWFDGKPVFYSLGNFVFGRDIDRSAILKVTVQPDGDVEFVFLPVYASGGVTHLAEETRAEETLRYLDGISRGAAVGSDGTVTQE